MYAQGWYHHDNHEAGYHDSSGCAREPPPITSTAHHRNHVLQVYAHQHPPPAHQHHPSNAHQHHPSNAHQHPPVDPLTTVRYADNCSISTDRKAGDVIVAPQYTQSPGYHVSLQQYAINSPTHVHHIVHYHTADGNIVPIGEHAPNGNIFTTAQPPPVVSTPRRSPAPFRAQPSTSYQTPKSKQPIPKAAKMEVKEKKAWDVNAPPKQCYTVKQTANSREVKESVQYNPGYEQSHQAVQQGDHTHPDLIAQSHQIHQNQQNQTAGWNHPGDWNQTAAWKVSNGQPHLNEQFDWNGHLWNDESENVWQNEKQTFHRKNRLFDSISPSQEGNAIFDAQNKGKDLVERKAKGQNRFNPKGMKGFNANEQIGATNQWDTAKAWEVQQHSIKQGLCPPQAHLNANIQNDMQHAGLNQMGFNPNMDQEHNGFHHRNTIGQAGFSQQQMNSMAEQQLNQMGQQEMNQTHTSMQPNPQSQGSSVDSLGVPLSNIQAPIRTVQAPMGIHDQTGCDTYCSGPPKPFPYKQSPKTNQILAFQSSAGSNESSTLYNNYGFSFLNTVCGNNFRMIGNGDSHNFNGGNERIKAKQVLPKKSEDSVSERYMGIILTYDARTGRGKIIRNRDKNELQEIVFEKRHIMPEFRTLFDVVDHQGKKTSPGINSVCSKVQFDHNNGVINKNYNVIKDDYKSREENESDCIIGLEIEFNLEEIRDDFASNDSEIQNNIPFLIKPLVRRAPYEYLSKRFRGYIRRFDSKWGFITSPAFDGDLFLHIDQVLPKVYCSALHDNDLIAFAKYWNRSNYLDPDTILTEKGNLSEEELKRIKRCKCVMKMKATYKDSLIKEVDESSNPLNQVEFDITLDNTSRCIAGYITTDLPCEPKWWFGLRLRGEIVVVISPPAHTHHPYQLSHHTAAEQEGGVDGYIMSDRFIGKLPFAAKDVIINTDIIKNTDKIDVLKKTFEWYSRIIVEFDVGMEKKEIKTEMTTQAEGEITTQVEGADVDAELLVNSTQVRAKSIIILQMHENPVQLPKSEVLKEVLEDGCSVAPNMLKVSPVPRDETIIREHFSEKGSPNLEPNLQPNLQQEQAKLEVSAKKSQMKPVENKESANSVNSVLSHPADSTKTRSHIMADSTMEQSSCYTMEQTAAYSKTSIFSGSVSGVSLDKAGGHSGISNDDHMGNTLQKRRPVAKTSIEQAAGLGVRAKQTQHNTDYLDGDIQRPVSYDNAIDRPATHNTIERSASYHPRQRSCSNGGERSRVARAKSDNSNATRPASTGPVRPTRRNSNLVNEECPFIRSTRPRMTTDEKILALPPKCKKFQKNLYASFDSFDTRIGKNERMDGAIYADSGSMYVNGICSGSTSLNGSLQSSPTEIMPGGAVVTNGALATNLSSPDTNPGGSPKFPINPLHSSPSDPSGCSDHFSKT